MSQSPECALIGVGFVIGLMAPGSPGGATGVLVQTVACIASI